MNTEQLGAACRAWEPELVRLACGETTEPSPALHTHLAICGECRAYVESAPQLVTKLRTALAAGPLPSDLVAQIHDRLLAQRPPMRFTGSTVFRLVTAAAAGLFAAFLWPGVGTSRDPTPAVVPETTRLTDADAATIVAVWVLSGCDPWLDEPVDAVTSRINEVSRTLERRAGARGPLPWAPEDDWDLPAPSDQPPGARRSADWHAQHRRPVFKGTDFAATRDGAAFTGATS
ncbi:MAG: hypothetical protein AB1601_08535 [Planctomycetota bacterium]